MDMKRELVDNPLTTYAQTLHDEQEGERHPGKIWVDRNMATIIGGFVRFYGTPLQNETVKRFKDIYETAQVGGGRACDPSVEPVDGGGVNPEAVAAVGADARLALGRVRTHLGRVDFQRLEMVAIGGKGPTPYAVWRTGIRKPNARTISQAKVEVRIIVLKLALFWDMAGTVKGRKEMGSWHDGSEYTMPSALDEVA